MCDTAHSSEHSRTSLKMVRTIRIHIRPSATLRMIHISFVYVFAGAEHKNGCASEPSTSKPYCESH